MKRRTQKLLSMLLALVMVLGLLPASAFAAGGSGTSASDPVVASNFAEFKAAMEDKTILYVTLKGCGTEVLPENSKHEAAVYVAGIKYLNVEGNTIFDSNGGYGYDCLLLVHGTASLYVSGTGTLQFSPQLSGGSNAVIRQDGGNVSVTGNVTLKSQSIHYTAYGYAINHHGGRLDIAGGTLLGSSAKDGGISSAVTVSCGEDNNVTISGGTFEVVLYGSATEKKPGLIIQDLYSSSPVKLSGGIFKNGIETDSPKTTYVDYLAKGCGAIEAEDGTITLGNGLPIPGPIGDTVNIGITSPVLNNMIANATAKSNEPKKYGVSELTWYKNGRTLTSLAGKKFENGQTYMATVELTAKPGYEFSSPSISAVVNANGDDKIASKTVNKHKDIKTITVEVRFKPVSDGLALISRINLSVEGYQINARIGDATVLTDSPNVTVTNTRWREYNGSTDLKPYAVFEGGKRYHVILNVSAADGYKFRDAVNTVAYLGGVKFTVTNVMDKTAVLFGDLPKLEFYGVDYIAAAIDRPVPGAAQTSVNVTVDSGKPYDGQVMAWSVGPDYETADALFGNFEAGKTYWANIKFDIKDPSVYRFKDLRDAASIMGSDGLERCTTSADGTYAEVVVKLDLDVLNFTQQPSNITATVNEKVEYTFTVDKTPSSCSLQKLNENGNYMLWNDIIDVTADTPRLQYIGASETPTTETYRIRAYYNGKAYYSDPFTVTWTAPATAGYTVKHMQEKLDALGTYAEVTADTQTLSGNVGENTAAAAKKYPGFVPQSVTQKAIAADGSTVVEIRYDRKRATFKFDANGGTGEMDDLVFAYGETKQLPANTFTREGYAFAHWSFNADGSHRISFNDQDSTTFTNANLKNNIVFTLYAQWEEDNTPPATAGYTVKHMQEKLDALGTYAEVTADTQTMSGNVGENTAAAARVYDGFVPQAVTQKKIAADGSTVVEIRYDRKRVNFKFDPNGGEGAMADWLLAFGEDKKLPANTLTRDGYTFESWNLHGNGSARPFVDQEAVSFIEEGQWSEDEIILYAQWEKAEEPKPAENPFTDVTEKDWFYVPVLWAVENGVTKGMTATEFGSFETCNRAQIVTFLWSAAGRPAHTLKENPFTDVPEKAWFHDAVLWAVENGITKGMTKTEFGPTVTCNRAQAMTFLWKFMRQPEASTELEFTDVKEGAWYYKPVQWAVENGITSGLSKTEFGTTADCLRSQIVTFLYKALPK